MDTQVTGSADRIVLGFGGYAESGKDAAADILCAHRGYTKTYMSKPLEQALLSIDPWVGCEHCDGSALVRGSASGRAPAAEWARLYRTLETLVIAPWIEQGLIRPIASPKDLIYTDQVFESLVVLDAWHGRDRYCHPIRYSELHAAVGYETSKKSPEVRRLLQILGTEIGRKRFSETIWLDIMLAEVSAIDGHVAVTGMRFDNEMAAIRGQGGSTVWVDRGLRPVNAHVSDNGLGPDDFDLVLPNRGSLDQLRSATLALHDLIAPRRAA